VFEVTPELTIPEKLRLYRNSRREMLVLYLGWPFAAIFSAVSFRRLLDRQPTFWAGFVLLVLWALMIVVRWHRLVSHPCPICGRTVFTHRLRGCKLEDAAA
jgi:hypothetical protein